MTWFVVEGRFDADDIDDAFVRLAGYFAAAAGGHASDIEQLVFASGAKIRVAREPTVEEQVEQAGETVRMVRESAARHLGKE